LVALLMIGVSGTDTFRWYNTQTVIAILGLALLPTAVGHSLYNYSLGSVKAVTANLFPLLEPIVASMFAVSLFGEVPNTVQIAGYILILTAVTIVATTNLK
jgi:drug/metabolite transporter (DMT)-like permease